METPPPDPSLQPQLAVMPPPEDPQAVIDALAGAEQQQMVLHAAENYNLASGMDEAMQREVAEEVFNGFSDDESSCKQWMDDHAFWLSLYMQKDAQRTADPSRDWGASESLPIMTEACDQFQARTYKIFFPNDTFVSCEPVRKRKEDREIMEERAKRIGDHMSYQLGVVDRSFKPDKDALFLGVALHGSYFTKAFFDEKSMRPKVVNVRPTDLIVNYTVGPVSIEDVRRKTHVVYTSVGETEDMVASGFFSRPAEAAVQEQGKNRYNVEVDMAHGLSAPSQSRVKRDAHSVIGEQHLYLDLDGKGIFRPYIATICMASRKLLRLTVGYEADPTGNPLKDYEQVQYFTHYRYKSNPDGFYGLGLGHSIGDLASAANVMLRQTMDAATLANEGNMSGFASEGLGLEEDLRVELGRLRKVPDAAGNLEAGIKMMQFPGPNEALIKLLDAVDQRAQRLASTTEATTGTNSRAEQPTTYLAQVEQALEMFSAVQMRLANSLGDELQKVYRLNQRYLPLVDYYVVNGEPEQIARSDYADDMMVRPIFDPKFASQSQKVARAQAELTGTLQNPVNQARPDVVDEAFRRYFKALDTDNVDALVPPQPQVENFDDQVVENMWFLMPKEARPLFDVFPDQDHASHLAHLQLFVAQFGQTLLPDQQEDVLKHQMKHTAYLYGQQNGIIDPPPPGSLPTPPLEARSDVPVGDGAASPAVPPAQAESMRQIMGGAAPPGGPAAGPGGAPPPAG
jgi:chaperonin GroES